MTAKEEFQYKRLQDLTRQGVDARSTSDIRFNSGSETSRHVLAKSLAAHLMYQDGWVVNGEVEVESQGFIDILAWGKKGRLDWAIELETDPPEDVTSKYLEQYIYGTPVNDLVVIDVREMPDTMTDALAWMNEQLPTER